MADDKRYYYLKVKDNFFDSEEMILLQSMQDGYLYSDILMKLYLRSLKNNGKLMFKDVIPYTPSALAQVVRHQVGTVEKALKIFEQLGLIEVLDSGAIYMLDIQNFIGKSGTEADRKRAYRARIDSEKGILSYPDKCPSELGQMSAKHQDKYPPELEIELEIDKTSPTTPPIGADEPSCQPRQDGQLIAVNKMMCNELGRSLSAIEYQQIKTWTSKYSLELIAEALKRAVLNGARNLKYIDTILVSWEQQNLQTVNDVEQYDKKPKHQTTAKTNPGKKKAVTAPDAERQRKEELVRRLYAN